jgi:thymidylate kinase
MIFVLEGHDLAGKTTTAARMSAELALPLVTPWAELSAAEASLKSISRSLLSAATAIQEDLLFDRFITSELIYGPFAGRGAEYIHPLLAEWTKVLPVCVLQISTTEQELRHRYSERRDHLFTLEEVIAIRERYEGFEHLLPRDVEYTKCHSASDLRDAIVRRRSLAMSAHRPV